MTDFAKALRYVLQNEGNAYVCDPFDRGGATRYGVTRATLAGFRGRPVTADDVRDVPLSEVEAIYSTLYWEPIGCDSIPTQSIATASFDCAVLCGQRWGVIIREQSCGLPVRGAINAVVQPMLMATMDAETETIVLKKFMGLYAARLTRIANHDPTQRRWLPGWLHRVDRLKTLLPLACNPAS